VLGGYYAPTDLQLVVKEARGARLRDVSGREYIDYLLGSGPMVLGHAHPAVIEAVERQISRGTTYFQLSEPAIALAEEICRAVPCADQLRFTSTGSEERGIVKAGQKIYVSLAHGEEEIQQTVQVFTAAFAAMIEHRR